MKVVGVDLGGTKILTRVVDVETGRSTGREKIPTPTSGPRDVLAAIAALVGKLDGSDDVGAVGVGIPGLVTRDGVVSRCPNIVGWDQPVDAAAELERLLERPVAVANDVNCGAVAEHRVGAGRGAHDLMAVFVGTGVGGGLILGDRLVDGGRGMAGEIGHVTVIDDGRVCGCGERGHLEAYAGRAGMEREARRRAEAGQPTKLVELAGERPMKSRHFSDALAADDDVAHDLIDDAVTALAIGLGNAATLLDLERIVLGGGVVDKLGQLFIDQIAGSMSFGGFGPTVGDLVLAQRLDDAGVVGAAQLAADRLV